MINTINHNTYDWIHHQYEQRAATAVPINAPIAQGSGAAKAIRVEIRVAYGMENQHPDKAKRINHGLSKSACQKTRIGVLCKAKLRIKLVHRFLLIYAYSAF